MSADPLSEAVDAILAKRAADADSQRALHQRRVAIYAMRHDSIPKKSVRDVIDELRAALLAAGVAESELSGLGISEAAVRKIVEGPRP